MQHDLTAAPSLRDQLARMGIESSTVRQRRVDQDRLVRLAERMARPEASVPGLEVTYLDAEAIDLEA